MLPYFLYFFVAFLPFGYRTLLYKFTSGFDEYEAVFLYASDIFLVLFLTAALVLWRKNSKLKFSGCCLPLAVFILFAAVSVSFAGYKLLALYDFARLFLAVLAALAIGKILKDKIAQLSHVFGIIAASAVFQAIVGFLQFFNQKSLGLRFLGESALGPQIGGAAKIAVGGGQLLRAYGTFPHPNILGAFLMLGLFCLFYFWLRRQSEWRWRISFRNLASDLAFGVAIFAVVFGLFLTFSRAAWTIALVLSFALVVLCVFLARYRHQAARLFILLFVVCWLLFANFSDFILPRAAISVYEPAVAYRLKYNELASTLIKNNPLGIGIGNQVIYSVKNEIYQKFGMDKVWQWQPIHNIYFLMASEIGVFGLLAFLGFVFLKFDIWNLFGTRSLEFGISTAMLLSLLLFGLADHFLWTLQPGRLMLWLVLGIMMGLNPPRRSMDRTQASEV